MFGAFLAAVVFATFPGPPIQIVPPDPAAAAHAEIVGATPAEAAWARSALTRLGTTSPVRRIVFDDHGRNRKILAATGPTAEGEWLARLAVSDIVGAAHAHRETIDWVDIAGVDGTSIEAYTVRPKSRQELRALAEAAAAGARRHDHRLNKIAAFQVADGGLEVVLRLSKHELLSGTNTGWLDDLIPKGRYEHLLSVLGPGGISVGGGGTFDHGGGGFWAYGSTTRDGLRAPRLSGPVHLRFHIDRTLPKARTLDLTLDCSGSDEGPRCSAFRSDWVGLLPPVVEGVTCSGPAGADELTIGGTVDGIPVRRTYDGCYGGTTLRWARILGILSQR